MCNSDVDILRRWIEGVGLEIEVQAFPRAKEAGIERIKTDSIIVYGTGTLASDQGSSTRGRL